MPFLEEISVVVDSSSISSKTFMTKHEEEPVSGLVEKAVQRIEQGIGGGMDGVKLDTAVALTRSPTSSLEVSPTDSGTVTPRPRLTIAPCPARLLPYHPPKNFGAVESDTIYRSGFPEPHNLEFMELLKLRTILSLVETEAEPDVQIFTSLYDINHVVVPIQANKDGEIRSTNDSLCQAILVAMNPQNYPLHIHCNRGKHRTGCIVALLRKIQRWPMDSILREYDAYSWPKGRPEDVALIKAFDPASVYDYAKEHDLVDAFPRESRVDSATDIWELAIALPPHIGTPSTISEHSTDENVMMDDATVDPRNLTYTLAEAAGSKAPRASNDSNRPEVSVAEVDEDVEMD